MSDLNQAQIGLSEYGTERFLSLDNSQSRVSDGSFSDFRCQKRRLHLIKLFLFGIALGLLYYAWICVTGISIPCVFHLITGLRCPGCGVTTMLYKILHLDFEQAFIANPFLFVTSPLLLLQGGYAAYRYFMGKGLSRRNEILLYIYCAALCVFGVLRNLPI